MSTRYQYRQDLVDKYFPRQGRLLDVGCGTGGAVKRYAERLGLTPYGVDVIPGNHSEINFLVYDGLTLPYESEMFDAIMVIHVLHHATDPVRLVAEISRVAKNGARVMILEDMASSHLQTFFTKASDLYLNKVRNFWHALRGRQKLSMVDVPMNYGVRSYPEWYKLFQSEGLMVLHLDSIPHRLVEHGVFILEKRETPIPMK